MSHHGHTRPWRPRQLQCRHPRQSPTQWAVLIHRCGQNICVNRGVLRVHRFLLHGTPLAHARSPHWLLTNGLCDWFHTRAFAILWIVPSSGGNLNWICRAVQGIWNPSNEFSHGAQARWLHSHQMMALGSSSDHELLLLGQTSTLNEKLGMHLIRDQHVGIKLLHLAPPPMAFEMTEVTDSPVWRDKGPCCICPT